MRTLDWTAEGMSAFQTGTFWPWFSHSNETGWFLKASWANLVRIVRIFLATLQNFMLLSPFLSSLPQPGDQTQGLVLARKTLYHWAKSLTHHCVFWSSKGTAWKRWLAQISVICYRNVGEPFKLFLFYFHSIWDRKLFVHISQPATFKIIFVLTFRESHTCIQCILIIIIPSSFLLYFKSSFLRPPSSINGAHMYIYEAPGLNTTFVMIQKATFVE